MPTLSSPPRRRAPPGFAALAASFLTAFSGACRHSPTEPEAAILPPIVLTGSLFADPISAGGNVLTANVCACVSAPLTVVSTGMPVQPLACNASKALGYPATYNGPLDVTVSAPTWSVMVTYPVPIDPHVGLRVRAECRTQ